MQVGLVSCTKSKRNEPALPRELYYTSPLFRKARAYCDRHHDSWYILSAKYGLLAPDGPLIEPYDETLTNATIAERRRWADRVAKQLDDEGLLADHIEVVVHAGKAYHEQLLPRIESKVSSIEIPTEGLVIGETLAWYNER